MTEPPDRRWPPVYDAAELASEIRRLSREPDIASRFYAFPQSGSTICQGDIVRLPARTVYLNENAEAEESEDATPLWLVVSNTCDFTRDIDTVRWSQIVPVRDVTDACASNAPARNALRNYETSRRFYLHPWNDAVRGRDHVAELLEMVTVDKRALSLSIVEARMSWHGWALFNACLLRFLARDDGRFA